MAPQTPTSSASPASDDQVLLFHGLMLIANPDGVVARDGLMALEAFFNTLPEFKGKDFDELLRLAVKVQARHPALKESVKEVAGLKDQASKLKLFVLAVDLAMSTGPLGKSAEELLETLAVTLGVDEETAVKIVTVMNLKYTS